MLKGRHSEPVNAVWPAGQRQGIEAGIQRGEVPSVSVAVARDGVILWEEAFGWADRDRGVRATTETAYSLASVTKPITATAVMRLVERGLVELDRAANDYLHDAQLRSDFYDPNKATIRSLLNHTSGLPTHYQFFFADEPYTPRTLDETIHRYGVLVSEPGKRYNYSNLGYGILGRIVETVSGQPLNTHIVEAIFQPLGMTTALFDPIPTAASPVAVRYGADGVSYPNYETDAPGASFAWCSAGDLLRFALLHLHTPLADQNPILPPASIHMMQDRSFSAPEPGSGADAQGLGWMITESDHGYRRLGFVGGAGGASAVLALVPDERIAVVALVNQSWRMVSGLNPWVVVEDVLAALLPPYAERLAVQRAGKANQEPDRTGKPVPALPPTIAGSWQGTVETDAGHRTLQLHITASGEVHGKLEPNPLPMGRLWMLVNEARVEDGRFKGVMAGDINTSDASEHAHNIEFDLDISDDTLAGAIAATSDRYWVDDGGAPGARIGNCLCYPVQLRRDTS